MCLVQFGLKSSQTQADNLFPSTSSLFYQFKIRVERPVSSWPGTCGAALRQISVSLLLFEFNSQETLSCDSG